MKQSPSWFVPAVASAVALVATASAQEAALVDEIVVTGTRIERSAFDFANPVTTFSADALKQSGDTNVADFLATTPALVGSQTGYLTGGSETFFGETGLNLLDLRNLGENRTLVLVDGRRHVSGLAGSAAVDIDTIPTDLIEAVDVLTGGASAIYGADGVSGVVNFRMKRDFEGVSLRGQYGTSDESDGDDLYLAFTAGQNFAEGRGNVAFAWEYNRTDRVSDQDRSFMRRPESSDLYQNQDDLDDSPDLYDLIRYNDVRYANSAPNGAVETDFDEDFIADYEGDGDVYDPGLILEQSGGYAQGGSSTPVDGYQGDLFPDLERNLANVFAHYDFSDRLTVFGEAKFVRVEASSLSQPTFDFYLFQTPENPFMPQSIIDAIVPGAAAAYFEDPETPDGVLVTRDNFDLGINTEDVTRDTFRTVIGANGQLTDEMRYEVSYVYGQTRSDIVTRGNRFEDRWLAAVDVVTDPGSGDPVCRSSLDPDAPPELAGCIPYDIFGNGVRDPRAIGFVTEDSVSKSEVTQHVVSASLSGNLGGFAALPGGPIGYAVGAEYRDEKSTFDPDTDIIAGTTWAGTILPESGSFDVSEVFVEVNAPILRDAPYADLLSVGGALRVSDYSTTGGSTSWKLDTVYAPVEAVSFRATYSQAVRAPNIAELFAPGSTTFNFIVDPCDLQERNNGTATREANCEQLLTDLGIDPSTFSPSSEGEASVFTEGTLAGNRGLAEETATTWTAGVVFRPTFVDNLSVSLDWYDIEIEDAINTPEAEELANLCVDQPSLENQFCGGITRDPDTGFISGFTVFPQNVASFHTAGLDVVVAWVLPTDGLGDFTFQLVGGYLDTLEFIASPGAAVDDDTGEQFAPEYTATFDASWRRGPFEVAYGIDWFSETDRFTREDLAGDPDYAAPEYLEVKDKWEHEVSASWDVSDSINIYAGIDNLFDQKPDFALRSYPISAMGRFFYAGAGVEF